MQYSDADAAALYEILNPWARSDDHYLSLVMEARSALDVGCGTGRLLHRARQAGHTGRLCGLDPDSAALDLARRHSDIEWRLCRAAEAPWDGEFELATMASNAFQCLVSDEELHASLAAIRRALVEGGRFAFDTRNPSVREWESWNPSNPARVVDQRGRELLVTHEVQSVEDEVVTLTESIVSSDGTTLRVDQGRLRFLDLDGVESSLRAAGFALDVAHGDWSGGELTAASRSFVVIARAV